MAAEHRDAVPSCLESRPELNSDNVRAIKASVEDLKAGEQGREFEQFTAEFLDRNVIGKRQ